jgi:hypothetical protein
MARRSGADRTDAELDRAIAARRAASRIASDAQPRAVRTRYDHRNRRIEVELTDGWLFAFPIKGVQGLSRATAEQLEAVEVVGDGYALHWDAIDTHYTVAGLLAGRLGSRLWMREHARHAGASTSAAKALAARRNGRKGGRPRKTR